MDMGIPASLLTHVKTLDVSAMKAAQEPVTGQLADLASNLKIAPGRTETGAESIASFQPRANQALKNLYGQAQAGSLGKYPIESKENARSIAIHLVDTIQRYANAINKYGDGDLTPGGAYTPSVAVADQLNDTMKYLEIRNKDNVEAARMQLVVDAALIQNTFGVEAEIFSVKDGKITINSFDMTYNGEILARSFGDGAAASYRDDGSIAVDTRV